MSRALDRLDTPLEFGSTGALSLSNRAVFIAEGYGLADPDGRISDVGFDFIVEYARHGWGGILLGLDSPGSPTAASLTPEQFRRLDRATRSVPIGLASAEWRSWDALQPFHDAGCRWFEAAVPIERPVGVVVGQRSTDVESLSDDADYWHAGPWHDDRLELLGGPQRHPFAEALPDEPGRPVMTSGRVRGAVAAERLLSLYPVDFVGIGRGAVAAPDMLDRARRGEDWMPCTGCMACLAPDRFDGPGCAVSPGAHLALPFGESSWTIVGVSAAVVRLALMLDRVGHRVTLFTGGEPIGGALRLRGRIPDQAESMEAAIYLRGALRMSGVAVERTLPEFLTSDYVVVSIAGVPEVPDDWNIPEPIDALDVLGDRLDRDFDPHEPVAVWGDTLLAAELVSYFEMIARPVRLVCSPDRIASDTHRSWGDHYRALFARRGLDVIAPSDYSPDAVANVVAPAVRGRHRVVEAILEARPDAVEVADAYEPFQQRVALGHAFRQVFKRFSGE